MLYQNTAQRHYPALVVFLVNISSTMTKPFGNIQRIQMVKKLLKESFMTMIQRSLRNQEIIPRYRISMITYAEDVADIYGEVQTVDMIAKKGLPVLVPSNCKGTVDLTGGFVLVKKILEGEIMDYTKNHPAPMVIHVTDDEFDFRIDPEPVVRDIQHLTVADGPVLVENIVISDSLKNPGKASDWQGLFHGEDLGSEQLNQLLSYSSTLPDTYHRRLLDEGVSVCRGTAMLYPAIFPGVIQMALAENLPPPFPSHLQWEETDS